MGLPHIAPVEESPAQLLERIVLDVLARQPDVTPADHAAIARAVRDGMAAECAGGEPLYFARQSRPERQSARAAVVAAYDPAQESRRAYARRIAKHPGAPHPRSTLKWLKAAEGKSKAAPRG